MRKSSVSAGRYKAVLCAAGLALGLSAFAAPSVAAPSDIAAKKAAILNYVQSLPAAHKTLAGVQVNEFEVFLDCDSADRIGQQVGRRPAILGLEMMNAMVVPPYGDYVLDRAVRQSKAGGLVTLTWHERNPVVICIRGEFFDCTQHQMSPETLKAVLTPGTKENKLWLADVDTIAKQLQRFKDAGIVVLWRPYHEMNGGWFWWGKKDLYPQLWDALYDRLVGVHHLDNLIWVWSGDRDVPEAARYAPVRHKPDVAGIDVYEDDRMSPKYGAGRDAVKKIFGDKTPFAITEVGKIPERNVIDDINPSWVLLWGGEYLNGSFGMKEPCASCNTPDKVAEFLGYDRTVMLDGMPSALRKTVSGGLRHGALKPRGPAVCPIKLR